VSYEFLMLLSNANFSFLHVCCCSPIRDKKKFFRDKFLNIERNKLHDYRKTNTQANDSLIKSVLCFLACKTDSIQEDQFYILRYLFS
jgi:hypothetical protein